MKTRLINLWDRLTGSYWFVPSILIIVALGASLTLPYLDRFHVQSSELIPQWLSIGPESARVILSTIAGTMATTLGLVFSITILTLSTATSQFGPRLLRSFLNNSATQIVLGTFVATVIYALLLLSMIRSSGADPFVPHVSVYGAILMSVFNLIYLIHFVNDISKLIQAPNVVAHVAGDLDDAIDRLFPNVKDENASPARTGDTCDSFPEKDATLHALQEGYLQGIDMEGLVEHAARADVRLRIRYHPGQFVFRNSPLADIAGEVNDRAALESLVNQYIVTGHRRTPRQDVECALVELVELAVRALSPGINDPFTAMNCLDRLGASLGRVAGRHAPASRFFDSDGTERVVMPAISFANLVATGFNQIRQNSRANTAVLIRMVDALGEIARQTTRPEDAGVVVRQLDMVGRLGRDSVDEPNDRADIESRIGHVQTRLGVTVPE